MEMDIDWVNNRRLTMNWVIYLIMMGIFITALLWVFFVEALPMDLPGCWQLFKIFPLGVAIFFMCFLLHKWFSIPLRVGLSNVGIHFHYGRKIDIIPWEEIIDIKEPSPHLSTYLIIKKDGRNLEIEDIITNEVREKISKKWSEIMALNR